jgi:hypothetical protein
MKMKTTKKLTKKMITAYLKSGGTHCPFCLSGNITAERLDPDGPTAWSNSRCYDCNKEWVDRFDLAGVSEVEDDVPASV